MIKEELRKKKPKFKRQDSHKKKRLKDKWKRPKGLHSKMRLNKKGYRKIVEVGYGNKKTQRSLIENLEVVYVNNLGQLKNIDKKKQGIIINSNVGNKKKIEIIKQAEKGKIKILNIKNPKGFMEKIDEQRKREKEEKEKKGKEKKEKKKAEKPKKKEEEKEEVDEEEKKKQEKKEKDKVLTKKE